MMSLTIAGTAVLNSLVADLSPELAAMLLASVIGGYTLIGGLGATFYVSYFNTALIFVLILMLVVEVFYNPFNNPENPFGSSESVFEFIACWKAPEEEAMGNKGGSYLTFFSSGCLGLHQWWAHLVRHSFHLSNYYGLSIPWSLISTRSSNAYG